jgi:glycyl-tRNA synthetase
MSDTSVNVMEKIVSLCKRRGFIYPASEIYGGLNGFWDYGPLGVLLKNNIRDWWWRNMVLTPPIGPDGHPVDIVGLDSAIIQNPKTWVASGHVGGFSDPMVDDKETKQRFRADHLQGIFSRSHPASVQTETSIPNKTVVASSPSEALSILTSEKKLRKDIGIRSIEETGIQTDELVGVKVRVDFGRGPEEAVIASAKLAISANPESVPSPFTGKAGTLTEPRDFNLMFSTHVGAIQSDESKAYLRPETAQGIFLQYKNIIDTTRVKIPFGVAQVGKSFRNEVTPRNFIFRSREFEQMEMEWFCHPDESRKWFDFWKQQRMDWWRSLGVAESNLRFRDHDPDELSHYSKMTVDIEYKYPFTAPDFGELEGIAHRGCFDLTQHQEHSGIKLDYFDQDLQLKLKEQGASADEVKAKSRYIPNVIEPASGLTRAVLVVLCEAYKHVPGRQGTEEMFSIKPQFAPIKVGVFPLVQKEGMPEVAEKLYLDLRLHLTCEYDAKQSIGRRYARMDEIGTPFCVTVDGETLTNQTVTVRERDSMTQERVATDKLLGYLQGKIGTECR